MSNLSEHKFSLDEQAFSIQYKITPPCKAMRSSHAHTFYEIFYVLSGEKTYWINDQFINISQGSLLFIPPYQTHRTIGSQEFSCEQVLINFAADFLENELARSSLTLLNATKKPPIVHFRVNEQAVIEELLYKMIHEARSSQAGNIEIVRSLMIELLIRIYRLEQRQEEAKTNNLHPMYPIITQITAYLNMYYHEPHTLESLAQTFYISPSYLSRIFKQITGLQFRDYLQSIRIREAKRLLRDTNLPMNVISDQIGFTHTSNFNVIFKKVTGQTPGKYRRINLM